MSTWLSMSYSARTSGASTTSRGGLAYLLGSPVGMVSIDSHTPEPLGA
ncbi:hypothetical protein ACIRYZ_04295 [Kitasatospora sp. NPDC101155]